MEQEKVKESCIHIDTIIREKMNFRVVNRQPKRSLKDTKDIERRLFEIFKKYEK